MKKPIYLALVIFQVCCMLSLVACVSPVNTIDNESRLTVAKAQKEIKIGMSSSDVVEVLGSPNMVTTDDQRRETWVYDRISTQVDASSSATGVWFILGITESSKASSRTSQRTLTIIIKFDNQGKVRDFAYRSSSF